MKSCAIFCKPPLPSGLTPTLVTKSLINIFTDAEPESDELAKSVWLLVSLLQLVLE
jgi:hypothetical protein